MISNQQPLVSVICLCYNHVEFIEQTLNSVLNQTYPNIELIIVDDYSTDHSRDVIKKWCSNNNAQSIIFNDVNLGMTKAFNKGLNVSTGKYIIDLAADDLLPIKAIENHIENFRKNDFQIGVSYGNAENIDKNNNHLNYRYPIDNNKKVLKHPGEGDLYAKILERFFISSPTMMADKKVFETLNGYDPNLFFEDFDFLVRASRQYPFFFSDNITIQKRVLNTSMSSKIYERNRGAYLHRKSFFKIFLKANKLNKTKRENFALIKRLHRELKICFKLKYFNYLFLSGMLITFCLLKYPFLKKTNV